MGSLDTDNTPLGRAFRIITGYDAAHGENPERSRRIAAEMAFHFQECGLDPEQAVRGVLAGINPHLRGTSGSPVQAGSAGRSVVEQPKPAWKHPYPKLAGMRRAPSR